MHLRAHPASPARYIEKVALTTGQVLEGDIAPEALLVQAHRDHNVLEAYAHHLADLVAGDSEHATFAHQVVDGVRQLGHDAIEWSAEHLGLGPERAKNVADRLWGTPTAEYYFRFKQPALTRMQAAVRLAELQARAKTQLERARGADGQLAVRVLLTGATGFVGQEILAQAVVRSAVAEVVALVRPRVVKDRRTGEVLRTITPAERGAALLDRLGITAPAQRAKVRFVAGDIEKLHMGLTAADLAALSSTITHVIYCAASVAFDAPYGQSYAANVTGTLNALDLALTLQRAPDSPFVAHLGVETSYIHGRQMARAADEDDILFPRNFYNNYYELTKAMAAIETDRFMLEEGLRVVQLCPAIVIGACRTGNNRGDLKVVNAPINAFGRAQAALAREDGTLAERSKGWLLARMALLFPGAPEAELNLIPVDWVVEGILNALETPLAVGERVHLATDNRLTAQAMRDIVQEELGVSVVLAEPVVHRNLTLPLVTGALARLGQPKLANALRKLSSIFGGYAEPGQPIHEVGHDVDVLGLPERRPDTVAAFRMVCRHNKYVQHFGQIRDADEVARRERVWTAFIDRVEADTGRRAADLPVGDFAQALLTHLDLEAFVLREVPTR